MIIPIIKKTDKLSKKRNKVVQDTKDIKYAIKCDWKIYENAY